MEWSGFYHQQNNLFSYYSTAFWDYIIFVVILSHTNILLHMDYLQKIIIDFELHDVDGIKTCFEHGVHPNQIFRGKPLIYELINMYARGQML